MKKIITTAAISCFALAAQAQETAPPETFDPFKDRQLIFDAVNICAVLSVIYLISSFILKIVKQHYDFRIKNKMLDKETEETIVTQVLQPDKKDRRNANLQWFFILAAIGVGLILVAIIRPVGLLSLAALALTIAAGFGAYYYFTRQEFK